MQKQWHLSEQDFFYDLPAEKEHFLSLSVRKCVKKDDFIFFEEESGDLCFYLEKGSVKIFRTSFLGKELVIFVRKAGEMFGLAEVIDGKKRKCSAQAITSCILYEIKKDDFEFLLSRYYSLARKAISILGRRLRYLCEQIENLMVCNVTTRVLRLLIYLTYQELTNSGSWNRPIMVPVRLTQEQIATLIGSSQQTVSETLKKLRKDGLILVSRKGITLLKPYEIFSRSYQHKITAEL